MKFKYFYKVIDCCQEVEINVYTRNGNVDPDLKFTGYICDAPIGYSDYTLYANEDGPAVETVAYTNKHGVNVTKMYIDLKED